VTVVLSAQGASGAFYPFLPFSDCSGFFEPYGGLQGWTLGFGSGVIQSLFPVIISVTISISMFYHNCL
jgi:hypothetical protein